MTVPLKIKNSAGPYTVKVSRETADANGTPTTGQPLLTLLPGEEGEATCWKGNQIVVKEVE